MALSVEKHILDGFLRDYLPVLSSELEEMDIRHVCGGEFQLRWMQRDGMILHWRPDVDSLEAILTATCSNSHAVQHCTGRDDAYNYLRLAVTGHLLAVGSKEPSFLVKALTHEVKQGWHEFKAHLETVAMPSWDRAIERALENECIGLQPGWIWSTR